MHITIDASNLRRGGGVTHLQEVINAADFGRFDITKVTIWGPQATLDRINDHTVVIKKSHPYINRSRWHALWFRWYLLDRLIDKDVDLLWVPGGTYLGKFRPYVTMLQNFLPFDRVERNRFKYSLDWFRFLYLYRVQAISFRKAAGLIHISHKASSVLNEQLNLVGVMQETIPHGLSPRFLLPPRQQLDFLCFSDKRPIRLLYVSQINCYKHQDKLIEAAWQLKKRGFPIQLTLIGPVTFKKAGRKLRILHDAYDPDSGWLQMFGEVSYSEIQKFYHETDLYVFLSSCETFGMILLEAMASGLPIVSSNRSALPEVAGGTCLEVDPEDVSDIASKIESLLLDSQLRTRLSHAAFERAKSFTWGKCADDTLAFLSKVLISGECDTKRG